MLLLILFSKGANRKGKSCALLNKIRTFCWIILDVLQQHHRQVVS